MVRSPSAYGVAGNGRDFSKNIPSSGSVKEVSTAKTCTGFPAGNVKLISIPFVGIVSQEYVYQPFSSRRSCSDSAATA